MNDIALIQALVGTPYRKANCWQIVCQVRRTLGLSFPELPTRVPRYSELVAAELSAGHWAQVQVPAKGTVVQLSDMHVGVWLQGGVLHSTRKYGAAWQTLKWLRYTGYEPRFWEFAP